MSKTKSSETIQTFDSPIVSLEGRKISSPFTQDALTYRQALITVCETHVPKQAGSGEALQAFNIGSKIQEAEKDYLELTDSEIDFLKKILDQSQVFKSVVIGRLTHFLSTMDSKGRKQNN